MTTPFQEPQEQPTPPGPGRGGDFDIPDWIKSTAGWIGSATVQAGKDLWDAQGAVADAAGWATEAIAGPEPAPGAPSIDQSAASIANALQWLLIFPQNELQEDITEQMVKRVEEMAANGELSNTLGRVAAQYALTRLVGARRAKSAAGAGNAAGVVGQIDPTEYTPQMAEICREQGFTGLLEQACIDALEAIESDDAEELAETPVDPNDIDAAAEALLDALQSSSNILFGRRWWRMKYAANQQADESGQAASDAGNANGAPTGESHQ